MPTGSFAAKPCECLASFAASVSPYPSNCRIKESLVENGRAIIGNEVLNQAHMSCDFQQGLGTLRDL